MGKSEQFPTKTHHSGNYIISTDPTQLDIDTIYQYLTHESYWATGITRTKVERFVQYSLCFGVYEGTQQIGFARTVSDYTTFAYLADVFILPSHQGQGLGKWLVSCVMAHPELQNLRRWSLRTADAHDLYARFGFRPPAEPGKQLDYLP